MYIFNFETLVVCYAFDVFHAAIPHFDLISLFSFFVTNMLWERCTNEFEENGLWSLKRIGKTAALTICKHLLDHCHVLNLLYFNYVLILLKLILLLTRLMLIWLHRWLICSIHSFRFKICLFLYLQIPGIYWVFYSLDVSF